MVKIYHFQCQIDFRLSMYLSAHDFVLLGIFFKVSKSKEKRNFDL